MQSRWVRLMDFNLMTEELGIDWEKDSLDNGDHLNVLRGRKAEQIFWQLSENRIMSWKIIAGRLNISLLMIWWHSIRKPEKCGKEDRVILKYLREKN